MRGRRWTDEALAQDVAHVLVAGTVKQKLSPRRALLVFLVNFALRWNEHTENIAYIYLVAMHLCAFYVTGKCPVDGVIRL